MGGDAFPKCVFPTNYAVVFFGTKTAAITDPSQHASTKGGLSAHQTPIRLAPKTAVPAELCHYCHRDAPF